MLTSKERFGRILKHQPVDRIGLFEVYWRETVEKWSAEGRLERPEMVSDHFGLDVRRTGGEITPGDYRTINLIANLDVGEEIVEETDSVKLVRDGNGALLRWIKNGSGAPEHVDFAVKDRRIIQFIRKPERKIRKREVRPMAKMNFQPRVKSVRNKIALRLLFVF